MIAPNRQADIDSAATDELTRAKMRLLEDNPTDPERPFIGYTTLQRYPLASALAALIAGFLVAGMPRVRRLVYRTATWGVRRLLWRTLQRRFHPQ